MTDPSSSVLTRLCATRAIMAVLEDGAILEEGLARQGDYMGLEARDRAFARQIAATTFRRMGQIDAALAPYVRKSPPPDVKTALRAGAAQLLFLDTPPHAAVGETVEVLRHLGRDGFSAMGNAVLRRVSEKGKATALAAPPKVNLPGWLRGSWEQAHGSPAMRKIAAQLTKSPPLDLSVKSDPAVWAENLGGQLLPTGTVRLDQIGDVTALDGFADGAWWAQDLAASLPVKMLDIVPGMRVLDLCAAPGGKTLQLAALGAEVTALDLSDHRMERLRDNLQRTDLSAELVVADALEWTPDTPFDAVLLDAPCSATGTLRRHPDVLHTKTPKQVAALTKLQGQLLKRACEWVQLGGQLVYAVCSLQPEEGHPHVRKLLSARSDFRLNPNLTTMFSKLPKEIISDGCLRSLPFHLGKEGGMDGFFAARFDRAAN